MARRTKEEAQETRTFDGLKVEPQGRSARVTPARVSVVVSGPVSQVRALHKDELRALVEVPDADPAGARAPVTIEIASGYPAVSVVETRPAEVVLRPAPTGGGRP